MSPLLCNIASQQKMVTLHYIKHWHTHKMLKCLTLCDVGLWRLASK